eukprot:1329577-Prorocentrum_lima.AAC.1
MTSSLVGSEMCIRDSASAAASDVQMRPKAKSRQVCVREVQEHFKREEKNCLLYTSDAADDM